MQGKDLTMCSSQIHWHHNDVKGLILSSSWPQVEFTFAHCSKNYKKSRSENLPPASQLQRHQWGACQPDEPHVHQTLICSHSSDPILCSSSSAGGSLACWATGLRDAQLCLMCSRLESGATVCTHTEVNTERALLVMTATHVPPSPSRWEADDSRWCVNRSAVASASLHGRGGGGGGGRQVVSCSTLIQTAGCTLKSLIVILLPSTSPLWALAYLRHVEWNEDRSNMEFRCLAGWWALALSLDTRRIIFMSWSS